MRFLSAMKIIHPEELEVTGSKTSPIVHVPPPPLSLPSLALFDSHQCLVVDLLPDELVLAERVARLPCDGVDRAFLHLLLDGAEEGKQGLTSALLEEGKRKITPHFGCVASPSQALLGGNFLGSLFLSFLSRMILHICSVQKAISRTKPDSSAY